LMKLPEEKEEIRHHLFFIDSLLKIKIK
jgi:hypothetical protein